MSLPKFCQECGERMDEEPVDEPDTPAGVDGFQMIKVALSRGEILAQLAEECAELSQAALKLRRVITEGANPTPVKLGDAENAVCEEIADVILCIQLAGDYIREITLSDEAEHIRARKLKRWAERCGSMF